MKSVLRFYKIGLSIIAVVFTLIHSGCIGCESDGEPTAEIRFLHSKDFTLVYGLNDDVVSAIPLYSTDTWRVPISISEDKTTIIFKTETSSDTLTIAYERNVRQESRDCGIRIFFKNIQIVEPTSFDLVYIVEESLDGVIANISVQDE